MKRIYSIEIKETLSRIIEVEANDPDEAENLVRKMYRDETIVLDSEDHAETEFIIVDIEV